MKIIKEIISLLKGIYGEVRQINGRLYNIEDIILKWDFDKIENERRNQS